MASNVYIKFDKVEGECEIENHKKWIEVLSWSHGFSQPASPWRGSTGSTVEAADHQQLNFSKHIDKATDELIKALWQGKQFEKVTMECYRADGNNKPIKYLEILMEDVVIGTYSINGHEGGLPLETLSLAYGKVTYTYTEMKKDDAKKGGAKPVSHDLKTNKVS